MDEIAVSVQNVSKVYPLYRRPADRLKEMLTRWRRSYHIDFWALRDISFDVPKGQTLGIIGQNGAGKSTLLQIIAGVLQPTTGTVTVNGRVTALLELGTGFNPEFTGRENVYMSGAILGISEQEMREKFDDIAAFAQIGQFIDQPVKTYSSGMYIRLAFAIAASLDPDLLIVDEALAVGDILFQRRCYRRMEELRNRGKTIVLVSHDIYAIQNFCEVALLLDQGEIIRAGRAKSVVDKYEELITRREEEYVKWLERGGTAHEAGRFEQSSNRQESSSVVEGESSEGEFRFGSRQAEIIDFFLLDERRNRTRVLETGKEATIVVVTRFHQTVENPIIGFVVHTTTGVNVFGANSWYAENEPGRQEKDTILRTEFQQRVLLNPGDYVISLSVVDKRPTYMHQLDRRMDVLAFRVMGEQHHSGLVDMETTITYARM